MMSYHLCVTNSAGFKTLMTKPFLSPVKRGDIGFSFSVCPSVRVRVQAIYPQVLNGKFLNFTYG